MAKIKVRYDVTMTMDLEVTDEVINAIQNENGILTIEKIDLRQNALRMLEHKADEMLDAISDNLENIYLQVYELIDIEDGNTEDMLYEH